MKRHQIGLAGWNPQDGDTVSPKQHTLQPGVEGLQGLIRHDFQPGAMLGSCSWSSAEFNHHKLITTDLMYVLHVLLVRWSNQGAPAVGPRWKSSRSCWQSLATPVPRP